MNKRSKEDGDENDPRSSNVYQKALKSFLGKEIGVKQVPTTPHQTYMQGKAVRPKRNILDDKKDELTAKTKKTLLVPEEKKYEPVQKQPTSQGVSGGSYRRPNSAPLKDKDKLTNPKKAAPPRPYEFEGYTSKYMNQAKDDLMASTKKEALQDTSRTPQNFGRTRDSPLLHHHGPATNAIYKGPVIKKKVLN